MSRTRKVTRPTWVTTGNLLLLFDTFGPMSEADVLSKGAGFSAERLPAMLTALTTHGQLGRLTGDRYVLSDSTALKIARWRMDRLS